MSPLGMSGLSNPVGAAFPFVHGQKPWCHTHAIDHVVEMSGAVLANMELACTREGSSDQVTEAC